jgi:ATP-dependent DNA helicase 2 subunit 1
VEGNYAHLYTLMDLDVPDAKEIKILKRLINGTLFPCKAKADDDALEEVCKPSKVPALMANVLFAANTLLTSKAARFGSKRVFLVTDDDDPGTKESQKSAITRARDLNDLGIRLEPFFISHPGKPAFDITKFYENVIYRDDEDQDDGEYHLPIDAGARFQTLLSLIKSKQSPRRSQFNILMEIGPGMEIGVKGFILFKRQEIQRSHYVYAKGEKYEEVTVETTHVDPVPLSKEFINNRLQVKLSLRRKLKKLLDSVVDISLLHLKNSKAHEPLENPSFEF